MLVDEAGKVTGNIGSVKLPCLPPLGSHIVAKRDDDDEHDCVFEVIDIHIAIDPRKYRERRHDPGTVTGMELFIREKCTYTESQSRIGIR